VFRSTLSVPLTTAVTYNWASVVLWYCVELESAFLGLLRAMNTLSNAEAIHISTVLEDCIDQLIILGRLMPVPYQKKQDAEQVCLLHVCSFL